MSTRKARAKRLRKEIKKHNVTQNRRTAAAAATLVKHMRNAKLRPGAAGVYRALLNPRVQGFLGLEKKFFDTGRAPSTIVTVSTWANGIYNPTITFPVIPGDTNCLSAPPQGAGASQRIGKSITIKSIQFKGAVYWIPYAAESAASSRTCFVALVLDTQTNGAQCIAPDIFQNVCNANQTLPTPTRNLLNAKRFKILKSEVFEMDPQTSLALAGPEYVVAGRSKPIDWYLPCEIPVNFLEETDSTVANVVDNSVHVVVSCSDPNYAVVAYNARIRFLG